MLKKAKKITKMLEDCMKLLRENDRITRKLRESGKNMQKYRTYIKKTKEIVDKIKKNSPNKITDRYIKVTLIKLEEVLSGNEKMRKKLSPLLKGIDTKIRVTKQTKIKKVKIQKSIKVIKKSEKAIKTKDTPVKKKLKNIKDEI